MLYIERDSNGAITAIHQTPTDKAFEQKTLLDEEIIAFLGRDSKLESWIQLLSLSDISIIRVIEDLIDVLVKKNVIMLTDLPEEAREKLNERKRVRKKMEKDPFIVKDII
ncbi:MAG TPA: hypothetical protein ENO11_03665 [Desulfobacteraceae bacterium]|nr:hypothetical protein [Desulfobacteraceae bacterium]